VSARRRRLLVAVTLAAAVIAGWAAFRHFGGEDVGGRVLMLDPRTGATLHQHSAPGGYAIAELLAGGRVAVASENGCPDAQGAWIRMFDESLRHVISERRVDPCMVARLNVGDLRARFEKSRGTLPDYNGGRNVIVRMGAGKIVETYAHANGLNWLAAMTAYDAAGHVVWTRGSLGRIGVVDARDGRVIVPVFGRFTLDSD
jgi:hypothetical protein